MEWAKETKERPWGVYWQSSLTTLLVENIDGVNFAYHVTLEMLFWWLLHWDDNRGEHVSSRNEWTGKKMELLSSLLVLLVIWEPLLSNPKGRRWIKKYSSSESYANGDEPLKMPNVLHRRSSRDGRVRQGHPRKGGGEVGLVTCWCQSPADSCRKTLQIAPSGQTARRLLGDV